MTEAITPDNEGRFSGVQAFRQAVAATLMSSFSAGVQELWLVDPNFAAWPLDDRTLLDAMTAWARGGRSRALRMLARQYDEVPRRHPRFTAWRRSFAHVTDCRAAPEVDASEFPVLVLAQPPGLGTAGVHGGAAPHFRGHLLSEESEWRTWREVVDAISQRSELAFPAHSLGL